MCGVEVVRSSDGSILQMQGRYMSDLKQATITRSREKDTMRLTPPEKTQKRGIDGSLQWLVSNVRVGLAPAVSYDNGTSDASMRADLAASNKIIRQARAHPKLGLITKSIP
eukprot:10965333-Alexandrium_andersonii.AAC.1